MSATYEPAVCPACGGSEGKPVAGAEGIHRELEALWGFHLRRLRPGVPPEALTDRLVFSREPPLGLRGCSGCGTVFRAPRRDGSELEELYARDPIAPDTLTELREALRPEARRQAERMTELNEGPGSVLEVGSYTGAFLEEAAALGWRAHGLEVGAAALSFLREQGLSVRQGTLPDVAGEAEHGRLDALVVWNCLDQVPDPASAVADARTLLRSGGLLGVRVPNGGLYRRLRGSSPSGTPSRAALPLLAWNNLLGFPYRTGFTPGSLAALLEEQAFRLVDVRGDVLGPLTNGWSRGWAAAEERLVKGAARALARWRPGTAPWLEVWARAV